MLIKKKKKASASAKASADKPAKKSKLKVLGKVVHYYDKLGVAIVELAAPLSVGDTVLFRRGEQELLQTVDSLQIEHDSVQKAKKGQVVGLKVDEPMKEGAIMLPAEV